MIPVEEATDLWTKIVLAAGTAFTALAAALAWVVKKQHAKSQVDSAALVNQLKSSNLTLADHLKSEQEMRERHHAENRTQSSQQHADREQRAREQHDETMTELYRGRDRDHIFSLIQGRVAAVVCRTKTDNEEQFAEMLRLMLSVDLAQNTFSAAGVYQEQQRRKRDQARPADAAS